LGILVQKFGGTSVADPDAIAKAAAKIIRAKGQGHPVVVTVSAPAGMTDELIAMAEDAVDGPDPRELDVLLATGEQTSMALLAMTLRAMGHPAVSLTGGQAGIVTDSAHTKARIQAVRTETLRRELDRGRIVVVAGFQGVDADGNITTLGRGGSDLTGVALAAALGADLCEIYTDVAGIYTADPRLVPRATRLDAVSHDEILELASMGAKVMQSRSIEVAKKFHVPVCVRSTFSDAPGTVICSQVAGLDEAPVCGVVLSRRESRVTLSGLSDEPGAAAKLLGAIGERNVNIKIIVQSFPFRGKADVSLLVDDADLGETLDVCEELVAGLGATGVRCDGEIARVSIVGRGMAEHPGVAARMCRALGDRGINVRMITTSEIYMSVGVPSRDGTRAAQAIHEEFELDRLPKATPVPDAPGQRDVSEPEAIEGYCVDFVDCDADQAELKIRGLADEPGQAALVLTALGDAGINLDLVVQNSCASGISVTMRRSDIERAKQAVEAMSPRVTEEEPQVSADIAKVSITGVGLRSHAGAASKVCGVLARAGINIAMIATSEVKMSVTVSQQDAGRAADLLREEFKVAA